ncbi:hypothetical protein EYS42_16435 [Aquabacterium lacunae]|uniref:DUF6708 domain-containing protein n=1 Tax=Aquabacterium lacunae TaxID=2528630 RepID=A0A4Q9H213_9BURK|nr:DUF6708 domain-containing protein [Aquabacterium lacunae]TBO27693.1 hypothetical protein EYS42_16435 [Aquabacterium lacunae]
MSEEKFVPLAVYLQDQRVAHETTAGGWVRGVYPNAIEYTTSAKSLRGVVFLMGGVGTASICFFVVAQYLVGMYEDVNSAGGLNLTWFEWFVVLPVDVIFLAVGIWALRHFARLEFFLPLDLPILFDRQRRKVYRLVEDLADKGKPKRRGQALVIEHDWDDIVAEHHVSTSTTGSSAQRHHTLVLMVRDKNPGDFQGPITPTNLPPYVDGFALGDGKVLTEFSTPRVWEHVRRYMNENGPALPPGEQLADTSVPVTWWDSLGAVSVFGPGYIQRWRESWGWMLIVHLFSPVLLPLALMMATTNWLSYKTAYPVQWPQEVLDKVGPPVPQTQERAHKSAGKRRA